MKTQSILKYILLLIIFLSTLNARDNSQTIGFNSHVPDNKTLELIAQSGVKWIRIDINWFDIERNQGRKDWQHIDRVTNKAHSLGLNILATIAYTPSWANNNKGRTFPPDNIQHWTRFIESTVRRYDDKIDYWAIWNEPNIKRFFGGDKNSFVTKIYLPAINTVKNVSPKDYIVGPGLSHLLSDDKEWYFWLKFILEKSGSFIDIISHHVYKDQPVRIFEVLETGQFLIPSVKDVIESCGYGEKPFWLTETGWQTNVFSEATQGDLILECLQTRQKRNYPHKIFIYEAKDDSAKEAEKFGVIRSNYTLKPAYHIIKNFIAGVYEDDDVDDVIDKDHGCLTEKASSGRAENINILNIATLREFREDLRYSSPLSEKLVKLYYKYGNEIYSSMSRNPILFKRGNKIINKVSSLYRRNGNIQNILYNNNQRKIKELFIESKNFITDLRKEKISPKLEETLNLVNKLILFIENEGHGIYSIDMLEDFLDKQDKKKKKRKGSGIYYLRGFTEEKPQR